MALIRASGRAPSLSTATGRCWEINTGTATLLRAMQPHLVYEISGQA